MSVQRAAAPHNVDTAPPAAMAMWMIFAMPRYRPVLPPTGKIVAFFNLARPLECSLAMCFYDCHLDVVVFEVDPSVVVNANGMCEHLVEPRRPRRCFALSSAK